MTGTLGKALKTTKMLGVIAIAFFLVFTLAISAFFILSTITLGSLNSDNDSLKAQVSALQSTETQVVLLKDRVGKIKTALNVPSAIKNLDSVTPFVSSLGPTASLNELDVDSQKVDFSVLFASTADLSTFLKTLTNSTTFTSEVMTSFGYSPTSGYLLGVRLTGK